MGARGRERGNGSVGRGAWERHCGNGTVSSKIFLHCMIEMIYFDRSIGMGGEGQQFFYYIFQKIFYIWEHGDGTVGTAPWERHRGNGTMGTAPWERQQFFFIICFKNIFTSYY